ncbi:histidine phosphatase family protein [Nitratireductor sp. ZSWI3]|uniref:SixA phosphatase family protein n=1 Tax=Nitratireductor sp. ZSWI3 TaxID=2966359 RepID=UPI0021502632|nr:histidine phosphatase family protein [Nitratireductor sp. ZSWI3]MCR4269116.1 histidine phosphatase family protein [Nitratireductor sp. ZSWI3]
MKELILLRHAKSSWDDPALGDFERPLAPRGRRAAPLMGREIARRGWQPDRVLVSAARRARQTWRLVAGELGLESEAAAYDEALYMASADRLLAAVRKTPEAAARLLLVGHNPGLEALAAGLAGPGSDEAALDGMGRKFPTAALAHFTFDGAWADLGFGGACLSHFLKPKDFS